MKKIILIIIIYVVITSVFIGCQTDEMAEVIEVSDELQVDYMPRWFESEEEFVNAINDKEAKDEHGHRVDNIDFYFVPQEIPDGAWLKVISVKNFYVALTYTYTEKDDPYWENLFLFEWYRTAGKGFAKSNVDNKHANREVIMYNHYYIVKLKPWGDYDGDKEYVCQDIYWEEGDFSFHAVVPSWFTEKDIEKYCVAKKVTVN